MSLSVEVVHREGSAYTLNLIGSLNSDTAPSFEAEVEKVLVHTPTILIFNLEKLDYLSSAGIRVFLKARRGLSYSHGKQIFVNMQPQIRKVFDIINAIPSMEIFASVDELDDYLDAMQREGRSGS